MAILLLQLGKLRRWLGVESTDSVFILVLIFVLYLLTLPEPTNHPLVGYTSILEGPYPHHSLETKRAIRASIQKDG